MREKEKNREAALDSVESQTTDDVKVNQNIEEYRSGYGEVLYIAMVNGTYKGFAARRTRSLS